MDMVKVALKHNEPSDPLDVLEETEKLFVKQKIETMEAVANAVAGAVGLGEFAALGETANKYDAYTSNGGRQFKVVETSERCSYEGWVPTGRACCRPNHKLQLHVYTPGMFGSREVLLLDRPFKCAGCCCTCHECCQQTLDVVFRRRASCFERPKACASQVYAATPEQKAALDPALKIATVRQPLLGGGLAPSLDVMDREGNALASISGPTCCVGGACFDTTFTVWSPEGLPIGKVTKEGARDFGELVQQSLTDADNFVLNFPKDTDKKTKAAMLSSLLLLDYMFFEDEGALACDPVNCACKFKCCDLYCCGCLTPCSCSCGEPAPPPPATGL
ncbi:phospholipid scramblase [Aureococcus anophagefferens]|uniref:Phospholipid scramblase n=1 Tax=Aureococcus anophagefferens TaxID=44056 RepID=A0ABR1GDB4_AURAN